MVVALMSHCSVLAWAVIWHRVRVRQCECAEAIARIENDKEPKRVGF